MKRSAVAGGAVVGGMLLLSREQVAALPSTKGTDNVGFYDEGKELLLRGLDLGSSTIKTALLLDDYKFDPRHSFRHVKKHIVQERELTNIVFKSGTLDGDDLIFTEVWGPTVGGIVMYVPGALWSKQLLCFQGQAVGLPLTPTGGDIAVSWSDGNIFSI